LFAGKDKVTMAEFEYAHDKQTLGTDWKSRVRDKEDLRITAYHEGGHTLVAYFTKNSKPLHKVTIAAKGMSGGHTAFLPEKDTYHQTRTQLVAMMDVSMGGRAAEEIILGKEDVTGGASSDLSMATNIAEEMVKRLGMSDKIGLRVYKEQSLNERGGLLGDATNSMIDDEVNTYLADSYKRASCILKTHRRELDLLADALLKYETLDAEDIRSIIDGKSVAKKKGSPSTILGIGKGASKPSSPLGGDHVFVQQPDGIRR
jgi:ATP-dependent metalloprotease